MSNVRNHLAVPLLPRLAAAMLTALVGESAHASGTPAVGTFLFAAITLLPGLLSGIVLGAIGVNFKKGLFRATCIFLVLFVVLTIPVFLVWYGAPIVALMGCIPFAVALTIGYSVVVLVRKLRAGARRAE